jgi:hypothetical protein
MEYLASNGIERIFGKFSLFVRQLLLKLNAFPGPRSVLVLNSAKAYHSADLPGIQRGQEVRAREKGRVFCT